MKKLIKAVFLIVLKWLIIITTMTSRASICIPRFSFQHGTVEADYHDTQYSYYLFPTVFTRQGIACVGNTLLCFVSVITL